MASLTLRDLPDDIMATIRILSEREKRSLNEEFLVIVREGLESHLALGRANGRLASAETQAAVWSALAGRWVDRRSTRQIVNDIRQSRTPGRKVRL
jgi:plasmid stability protein